jgi:ubiquinone/menaquinone biosynthesis C-methylase UbiE
LESGIYGRLTGTDITLARIGLKPGQRVLELGPGPGRLLIPAAHAVQPGGEAVGIEIQPVMVRRLQSRARMVGANNLTVILGDATESIVPPGSFELVFLAMTLGEIPDRAAALKQSFSALKPGGVLSITEMLPDPHYQSRGTVKRLAEAAGFQFRSIAGNCWLYTANFEKPARDR